MATYDVNSIYVGDGVSYPPSVIKEWCEKVMRNEHTSAELRDKVTDFCFRYFINSVNPPSERNRFFLKSGTMGLYLKKDDSDREDPRDYIINYCAYDCTGKMQKHAVLEQLTPDEAQLIERVLGRIPLQVSISKFHEKREY